MLPANDEQLGGTNVGSPMLPASSCHESFGGGNQCFQPMMLPMLEATTCFLPVVAMIHLGGATQCFLPMIMYSMMLPMLEASTCFLQVVAMNHLGGPTNASNP